jgi:hypothetical protein
MRFFRCYFVFETDGNITSLSKKLSSILFGGAKFVETLEYDCECVELIGKVLGCKVRIYKSGDTCQLDMQTDPDECLDVSSEEAKNQEALLAYILKVLADNGMKCQGHLFSEQKFSNAYFKNKSKNTNTSNN